MLVVDRSLLPLSLSSTLEIGLRLLYGCVGQVREVCLLALVIFDDHPSCCGTAPSKSPAFAEECLFYVLFVVRRLIHPQFSGIHEVLSGASAVNTSLSGAGRLARHTTRCRYGSENCCAAQVWAVWRRRQGHTIRK